MTVQEFFDRYDAIRKTTVKDAPAIKNRTLKQDSSWDKKNYTIESDSEARVGTRIYCRSESAANSNNLDLQITGILQFAKLRFSKSNLKANTRACLAVFSGDVHLLDKLKDFYDKNDCRYNDTYPGLITSEGFLITYYEWDLNEMIHIYYVKH